MGFSKNMFLACGVLLFTAFSAGADDAGGSSSEQLKVISQIRTGAADYHATYASIFNTTVILQGYNVRLNDGRMISVPSPRMNVDLQDLFASKRGLLLDLRQVNFPDNSGIIDVVEIEAKVVDCSENYINFRRQNPQFGQQCALVMPKSIILFSSPAPFQMLKDEYLVKIKFSPLDHIQLDVVTTTKQKVSCWSAFSGHKEVCRPSGPPKTFVSKRCELVNRRMVSFQVSRPVDEFAIPPR